MVALLGYPNPKLAGDLDMTAAGPSCGDLGRPPERRRLLLDKDSLVSGDLDGTLGLNMLDLVATE